MCRSFNRRTTRTSPSARPGDAAALAPAVRATVRAIDREQAILNLNTMTDLIRQEAFVFAYMAGLMGAFGLLALSSVGVYGVMAYVVSGQTHEIGIRMALGAPRGTVLAMLFRRGMWTALAGLSAGLIPAYGLARLMRAVVSARTQWARRYSRSRLCWLSPRRSRSTFPRAGR